MTSPFMPKPVDANGIEVQVEKSQPLPLPLTPAPAELVALKAVTVEVTPEPIAVLFTARAGTAYPPAQVVC